ncbi:MAG: hypothetical protein OJF49_001375 [Ktedonobacterales bacterium]|jgi:hypothetical protein|nr:MAG: hypothetical protein OJF49_001375 [Ktedonobacterales bacterium]
MWGRRNASTNGSSAKVAGTPKALSALDDLLRQAEWDRLSDADRTALLSAFPQREAPTLVDAPATPEPGADEQLQDWVAGLVAARMQPELAGVVRGWLAAAPPDAHLFVSGSQGQGRTSLIASLAREAMRARPAQPDYCYVPDPAALDRPTLLLLPAGTGDDFLRALSDALGQVCQSWDGDSDDSGDDDKSSDANAQQSVGSNGASASQSQNGTAAGDKTFKRGALIAAFHGALTAVAPKEAAAYLDRLRGALDQHNANDTTPPLCGNDMPIGNVRVARDGADAANGAPVVVTSLAQTGLTDALLQANGGVLILPAADLLDSSTWTQFAGALKSGTLALKSGWPPLPLSVRVALIGSADSYRALYNNTEDFVRLFRYEAWANWDVAWGRESEAVYAALAAGVSKRYGLPPFDASAVARLVEENARRVDTLNRSRLGTNLLLPHDIALEAGRAARTRSAAATTGADVDAVLQQRRALQSMNAQRVREAIMTGAEITPTDGTALGQINGLGIYEVHPWEGRFAVPMRISVTVSPGRDEQLFDIEQAVSEADANHVRGALTVEGYLTQHYSQNGPVNAIARVRFEQEHGATGGDSASAALLFALLSALADAPIRCSYAITGAVGQYGEIQPIGGVNTKIEGFWEICRQRRAQGERPEGGHGVLIPTVNARDVMLRPEVAMSIAHEGWFHIFPISTVDDGIPLLMGLSPHDLHERVQRKLKRLHALATRTHSSL